jgi:hypothetical protein
MRMGYIQKASTSFLKKRSKKLSDLVAKRPEKKGPSR